MTFTGEKSPWIWLAAFCSGRPVETWFDATTKLIRTRSPSPGFCDAFTFISLVMSPLRAKLTAGEEQRERNWYEGGGNREHRNLERHWWI